MFFTRDISPGNFLARTDIDVMTSSPSKLRGELEIYNMIMSKGMIPTPYVMPVSTLYGFCETPDTYSIQTASDVICVYCKPHETSLPDNQQNFIWDEHIAITVKIDEPSLVFLKVQGNTLAYDEHKLLYVDSCLSQLRDPIKIMFFDNYGVPQISEIEKGEVSISDSAVATFKGYSDEITYNLGKTPVNAISVGQNNIPFALKEFYSSMTNSLVYAIVIDGELYDCELVDASLTAEKFNRLYAFSANIQLQTKILHLL